MAKYARCGRAGLLISAHRLVRPSGSAIACSMPAGERQRATGAVQRCCANDHPDAWPDPRITSRALDWRFRQIEVGQIDFRRVER